MEFRFTKRIFFVAYKLVKYRWIYLFRVSYHANFGMKILTFRWLIHLERLLNTHGKSRKSTRLYSVLLQNGCTFRLRWFLSVNSFFPSVPCRASFSQCNFENTHLLLVKRKMYSLHRLCFACYGLFLITVVWGLGDDFKC